MTGAAQVAFPAQGRRRGQAHRPRLLQGPRRLSRPARPRPDYAADATFFNNLGPNQKDLAKLLRKNARQYLRRERPFTPGLTAARDPLRRRTTSASGVDPDISDANARIQANRVAAVRGIDRARAS